MSKAVDAFRTISEVSEDLGVPKHVLRFWEQKFPQIKPMKRGGGRRYYRPEDMELLRGIRHLLHAEAYTIKGVQKILRTQGIDVVKTAAYAGGTSAVAAVSALAAKVRRRKKGQPELESAVGPAARPAQPHATGSALRAEPVARSGARGPDEAVRAALGAAIAELEATRLLLLSAAPARYTGGMRSGTGERRQARS
ncbi:MAG: MerR family transcriptional regulator [Hyphomicrobiaceae bacterium]|nr:MerR family transcriptional regulator [Hyphomicrobiaceae bacterium]